MVNRTPALRDITMAGRWSFPLVCFLLLIQQDHVTSQTMLLRTTGDVYWYCSIDNANLPTSCASTMESDIFTTPGTFVDFAMQSCDASMDGYFLFNKDGTSQLYRVTLPPNPSNMGVPVLMDTHPPFTSFDLCCNTVIYALGPFIFADNLDEDPLQVKIAAELFRDAEGRNIQHVEVCCYNDRYEILFSIDDIGLYSLGMDGSDLVKVVDYGGSRTIVDMDYNCNPNNGYVVLAVGTEVRLLDFANLDPESLPIVYSDITLWDMNSLGQSDDALQVSLGTLPSGSGPVTMTLWADASSEKAWITTTAGTPTDATSALPDGAADYQAVFYARDAPDLMLPCPDTCPCSMTDDYQDCCIGLCVPRNDIDGREYSCYCNNPNTLINDHCLSEGTFESVPSTCPLDLIGAIKCQGGNRDWSSSIYALSMYSLTSICPTAYSGKETPMPRGAIPFRTNSLHSSGYLFKAPTQFRDYKGDRYGLYAVGTGTAVNGATGELVDSLPVVFQESSKDLYAEYVTKTLVLGSDDNLRVRVRRPCDVRRLRWRKNGRTLHPYKGKLTVPLKSFSSDDEGIYEAYFQGRIKRDWRVIIRVAAASSECSSDCTDNGGFCSYGGSCVCPPGKAGVTCQNACTKGTFGVIGSCGFSCQQEFGDDFTDCQNILFCLEDPAGCHCYPGYELPNCTPCSDGYWGLNCANRCEGGACDPYDGTPV